jgi:nucleoside diphosphate kinase
MPADQRTLMLLKPDVYEKGLTERIVSGVREQRLTVEEHFRVRFTPEGIFHLWPRIYGRRWTSSLMDAMPRNPLDVYVLSGENAIDRLIEFKDALRESNAKVNSYRNLLHSPDSPASFQREYAYLSSIRVSG